MNTPRRTACGLASAILALLAAPAGAVTQTFTASYTAAPTEASGRLLEVPLFDPALGVLNAATLSFSGSLSASTSVFNTSSALNLTNVPITVSGGFQAVPQGGKPAAAPAVASLVAANTVLGTRTFVILGPGAQTSAGPFTLVPNPAGLVFAFSAPSDVAGFAGSGTLGYVFTTQSLARTSPQFTSVALQPTSTSSATMSVLYDYTPSPVPEPGTWALLMAGLAVVGTCVRQRLMSPVVPR